MLKLKYRNIFLHIPVYIFETPRGEDLTWACCSYCKTLHSHNDVFFSYIMPNPKMIEEMSRITRISQNDIIDFTSVLIQLVEEE